MSHIGNAIGPLTKQSEPAYRQLYEQIRTAILSGQFAAGTRLPASRQLADEMGVSRNTILAAYDQLHAEGYVEGRRGSGTYVAGVLPDRRRPARYAAFQDPGDAGRMPRLSVRGTRLSAAPRLPLPSTTGIAKDSAAFQIGLPALDGFPHRLWARLYTTRVHLAEGQLMRYGDPAGFRALREQIAAHVATSRGIRCTADQIVIVSGSQQALEFCCRILLDRGSPAWLEDPCYLGARAALISAEATLVPVPVDSQGLDVIAGVAKEPCARLTIVTPSHQFPLGVTMSLERRLALIDWAVKTGSWIVEDDYESEFRYRGRPLAALKSIDSHNRVIYVGTFSKTMFPALRLGYIIAPDQIVDALIAAHLSSDVHVHLLDQAVMADFLAAGHYARHVRRMRMLCGQRQQALISDARRLGDLLRVEASGGGLHAVGWLPAGIDDREVAERAAAAGVHVWPLSLHTLAEWRPPALLLGYAGTPAPEIRRGIDALGEAIGFTPVT